MTDVNAILVTDTSITTTTRSVRLSVCIVLPTNDGVYTRDVTESGNQNIFIHFPDEKLFLCQYPTTDNNTFNVATPSTHSANCIYTLLSSFDL